MEWTVSEDNQWRQLGSIVNAVLLDTRAKAIRKGTVSAPPLQSFPRKTVEFRTAIAGQSTGHGFLSTEAPAVRTPVQLELPFGIAAAAQSEAGASRAPRSARLM